MRAVIPAFAVLGLAVLTIDPAAAQRAQHRGTQAEQEACTPDVFRLCMGFIPNEPRIVQCLVARKRELSPACRKVFADVPDQRRRKKARQVKRQARR